MKGRPAIRSEPTGPRADDAFLVRICKALDLSPRMVAYRIGVPYSEVKPLLSNRWVIAEIDRDEVWWKVAELIDQRIGELMGARREMQAALQRDRTKRAARLAAQRRHAKGSPRGRHENEGGTDDV